MKKISDLSVARKFLTDGLVIAYPTEAVYGLGCDPFNESAVNKILSIKGRAVAKGLILLISNWQQLYPLIDDLDVFYLERVKRSWPGHATWIFPKSRQIPDWLTGENPGVAIRMTNHPIARELCVNNAIVSTSANFQGQEPARNLEQIEKQFNQKIDGVVLGDLGMECNPSPIYDVLTGLKLR